MAKSLLLDFKNASVKKKNSSNTMMQNLRAPLLLGLRKACPAILYYLHKVWTACHVAVPLFAPEKTLLLCSSDTECFDYPLPYSPIPTSRAPSMLNPQGL